jgi:hypothetical protein
MFTLITNNIKQRRANEIPFFWWRIAIIIVTLLLSLALPQKLPSKFNILVYVLLFTVLGSLLLLYRPPIGLVLLIAVAPTFPFEIVNQIGIVTIIVFGLMGLWLFDMFILRRQIVFLRSSTIPPLILLIAGAVISFGVGQFPWYPVVAAPLDAQLGGILIFIVAVGAFILVANQVTDLRWLQWMVFVFLGVGAIYVVGRISPSGLLNRWLFPSTATGSLFWIWLVSLSFSQGVFNKQLSGKIRIALLSLTAATLYVVLVQTLAWSSGWIPSLITLGIILWVGLPRVALPVSVIGGGLAAIFSQTILTKFIYIGDNAYSQATRLEAWKIVGEIVKVSPILGLGPANYSSYTPLFPILGWYVQFNSHNNYIDIVAQTGLLGLAAFAWFGWEISKLAWNLRYKVAKGGFEQAYVYGAIGGVAATFVAGVLGDWILPFVYNITIRGMRASVMGWLFMGGLLAIEHIVKQREATS